MAFKKEAKIAKMAKISKGQEDDDDDALLDGTSKSFTDSIVLLCIARFFWNLIIASTRRFGTKATEEAEKKDEKKKGKEKPEEEALPLKEQLWIFACKYKIPVMLAVLSVLCSILIIGGEPPRFGDDMSRRDKVQDDYYGTLGVARDAENGDVKRAYKTLAKRYHPDRNPNCSTCRDTFTKIAEAYETLSDEEKRASYDTSGGVASSELKSPKSVPLTRENFDDMVTYSNDVWIVQVFRTDDGSCAQFHPFWENQIIKYGHLVRFGRIDVTNGDDKWLPVKVVVLPMVLKFARHLSSPEIFPITAIHETPQHLMKFVLMSFPNIGLPLQDERQALANWLESPAKKHKVLFVIPGKSQDERYKSHLVLRMLASKWSDLFEMRTAEAALVKSLPPGALPEGVKSQLLSESDLKHNGQVFFFPASGGNQPREGVNFPWPVPHTDVLVQSLLSFAKLTTPAISARTSDLLCRSLGSVRVYCLVVMDGADSAVLTAGEQLDDSRSQYQSEVEQIRNQGGDVSDEEDNFLVMPVKLLQKPRGLQPCIANCLAPQFDKVRELLQDDKAMLMDLDTNRVAKLEGVTSYRGIYPMIAYEDNLKWEEEVLHPHYSLPDCREGIFRQQVRALKDASIGERLVQLITFLLLIEAVLRACCDRSLKWSAGAVLVLGLVLLRSPPFLRWIVAYVPARFVAPVLASAV